MLGQRGLRASCHQPGRPTTCAGGAVGDEPIRQIVENAGLEGSVIVEKVRTMVPVTRGFDAETNEFVDMIKAGIIDPTKVERVARDHVSRLDRMAGEPAR